MTHESTDLNFGVRDEMISEARSLCQTFPIAKRITNKYANYCVGRLRIKWNTRSRNKDLAYESYWRTWMAQADIKGVHRFPMLMKIAVKSIVGDGDIFIQKVNTQAGPRVAMIEGDRVTGAPNGGILNIDTDTQSGGVNHDAQGRPVSYRVCDRNRWGYFINPKDQPASQFFHLFNTDRIDAYRAVTQFSVALNALRDLKEIIDAEKTGVKNASKLSMLVKTMLGQANKRSLDTDTTAGGSKIQSQQMEDGTTLHMFPGEDVKSFESNRPSMAWQGFIEWLVRMISIGLDLPYEVVWSMAGMGSVAARAAVRDAERTFSEMQDLIEDKAIEPIVIWVMSDAITNRLIPDGKWWNFSIPRPAGISLDIGRDTNSALNEIKMGVGSGTDYAADGGKDIYQIVDDLIKEESYVQDQAKKAGVDPDRIRMLQPNGQPGGGKANGSDTEDPAEKVPDEEEDPKGDDAPEKGQRLSASAMADGMGFQIRLNPKVASQVVNVIRDKNGAVNRYEVVTK